jgi:putative nucleotidyltransferase with HDIG domain
VVDAKSPFTARHSQNVAFLATRTACELGIPRREVRALRRAALLHDVGKLGVSNSILDKPGALDAEEMLVMQRHTGHTLDILSKVTRFQRFAGMAAAHHERLDGTGYHLGLKSGELSLSARVLAVSDVCEALSADRPYRPAMPLAEVMHRLTELTAAGQLCPVATEALTGWFGGLPGNTSEMMTSNDDSTSLLG